MLPKDTSREVRGPHQDYIIASPSSKRGRGHRQGGQRPTSGLYKHSPFSRRGQGHKQRGQKWLHQDYIIMRRKILLTHHRDIFPSPEAYSKEKNAIEP